MLVQNRLKTKTDRGISKLKRFTLVAVPASALTLALFMSMEQLVHVEDFEAPALNTYDLNPYIEPLVDDLTPQPETRIVRPDTIAPPPPAPRLINAIENVKLPISDYVGAAPADYGAADLDQIRPVRTTSMTIRALQPLTPPVPSYPRAAILRGLEGDCDVHLSVSTRGEPFNVSADCTHRAFKAAAESAIKRVKFAPKIHQGLPVTVTGVVYPLEFRMEP